MRPTRNYFWHNRKENNWKRTSNYGQIGVGTIFFLIALIPAPIFEVT